MRSTVSRLRLSLLMSGTAAYRYWAFQCLRQIGSPRPISLVLDPGIGLRTAQGASARRQPPVAVLLIGANPSRGRRPVLATRSPCADRCGAEPLRRAAGRTCAPTPPWPGGPKSGRRRLGVQRSPRKRAARDVRRELRRVRISGTSRANRAVDLIRGGGLYAVRRSGCFWLARLSPRKAAARVPLSSSLRSARRPPARGSAPLNVYVKKILTATSDAVIHS